MNSLTKSLPTMLIVAGLPAAFLGGRLTAPNQRESNSLASIKESKSNREATERKTELPPSITKEPTQTTDEESKELFRFEAYTGVSSPAAAQTLLDSLLRSMAVNPEKTFQFAQENELVLGEDGIESLLAEWSKQDPEAAWKITKEQYPERTDEILGVIAKSDSLLALQMAKKLHQDDPSSAYGAITAVIRGSYFKGGYDGAIKLIQTLEKDDPEFTKAGGSLYQVVLDEWSKYAPQDAAQWVVALQDDANGTKEEAQQALIENWSYHDPNTSLEYFIKELPPGDFRTEGITSSLTEWAGRDFLAASDWIVDNGLSAEFDEASYHLAISSEMMTQYPDTALEWVKSLSDTKLQDQGLTRIYQRWFRTDQAAAEAHMNSAGDQISAEIRNSIQENHQRYLKEKETLQPGY